DQGGSAIAVYNADDPKTRKSVLELRDDGRAHLAGPGDYTENSPLDCQAQALHTEMAARAHAKNLVQWPDDPS
ncbi:MAG: hypothetical protein ACREEG_17835, partial [Phenylobacterium sp.]